jgi:hypothetical protein
LNGLSAAFVLAVSACGGGDSSDPAADASAPVVDAQPLVDAAPPSTDFNRFTIDVDIDGPAWVTPADFGDDGSIELVVSSFGDATNLFSGEVRIYSRTGSLDEWQFETLLSDVQFPNQTSVVDVDGDDDLDILVPCGFFVCAFFGDPCGAIVWLEQTESGWESHDVVTANDRFYHNVELFDVDGDGTRDLVTVGETYEPPTTGSATVEWYEGSASGFTATMTELGAGLGSFPRAFDVDGDDDLDLVGAEYFHNDLEDISFAWYERNGTAWTRHVINDDSGPSIMAIMVPDLYGDGVAYAVGTNHVNDQRNPPDPWESAVMAFQIPDDPTQPWPKTQLSEGIRSRAGDLTMNRQDAPGVLGAGDVDGDGDIDIVVSGDGDERTFWLEQLPGKAWSTHVIQEGLGQAGGQVVTDLDGDGDAEILVTSYEADVIYAFEWNPEPSK